VKPSNIMVMAAASPRSPTSASRAFPTRPVKTMTGLILGSPRYMSPEQVIGKTIDARSDIFSLGVVLYEALTAVAPFDGDNVNAIMYATVNTSPPPPSQHNRVVPAMLDLIVAKAMAKLLEDRYQTIKELADDLREVRRQMDSSRPAAALKASNAPVDAEKPVPIVERHVDTATLPMGGGRDERAKDDDAKAVPLAKTFDSFDATLRLAADDRPDRGLSASTSRRRRRCARTAARSRARSPPRWPAQSAPPPPAAQGRERPRRARPAPSPPPFREMQAPETQGQATSSNLIAVAAIVVLSIAAVALTSPVVK
jgi:serine/threonine-protein kinase